MPLFLERLFGVCSRAAQQSRGMKGRILSGSSAHFGAPVAAVIVGLALSARCAFIYPSSWPGTGPYVDPGPYVIPFDARALPWIDVYHSFRLPRRLRIQGERPAGVALADPHRDVSGFQGQPGQIITNRARSPIARHTDGHTEGTRARPKLLRTELARLRSVNLRAGRR
jgi:hypothetical protein